MEKKRSLLSAYSEVLILLGGELILSLLIVGVHLLLVALGVFPLFDYRVVTGAALGSAVAVLNLFILSFAVNRAVDKYIELRGEGEMSEEEAASFAAANANQVRLAAGGTYLIRTLLMLAAIVGAFLLGDYFDVLSTVIPLLMYKPILMAGEWIRKKLDKPKDTLPPPIPYPEDKDEWENEAISELAENEKDSTALNEEKEVE